MHDFFRARLNHPRIKPVMAAHEHLSSHDQSHETPANAVRRLLLPPQPRHGSGPLPLTQLPHHNASRGNPCSAWERNRVVDPGSSFPDRSHQPTQTVTGVRGYTPADTPPPFHHHSTTAPAHSRHRSTFRTTRAGKRERPSGTRAATRRGAALPAAFPCARLTPAPPTPSSSPRTPDSSPAPPPAHPTPAPLPASSPDHTPHPPRADE